LAARLRTVITIPALAATVADFTRRTGIAPAPGGAHVGLGTRNYLVGLGGPYYLEIVGPDPAQPTPPRPRPFGIDRLTEPCTVTWAIRPPDPDAAVTAIRAAGHDPGPLRAMSRRRPDGSLLEWRLTDVEAAGVVPFLIDWGATEHPSAGLPSATLLAMSATTPDPGTIRDQLAALGTDLTLDDGPARLSFRIDTPEGELNLS
jgi:glyoxalase-like protein